MAKNRNYNDWGGYSHSNRHWSEGENDDLSIVSSQRRIDWLRGGFSTGNTGHAENKLSHINAKVLYTPDGDHLKPGGEEMIALINGNNIASRLQWVKALVTEDLHGLRDAEGHGKDLAITLVPLMVELERSLLEGKFLSFDSKHLGMLCFLVNSLAKIYDNVSGIRRQAREGAGALLRDKNLVAEDTVKVRELLDLDRKLLQRLVSEAMRYFNDVEAPRLTADAVEESAGPLKSEWEKLEADIHRRDAEWQTLRAEPQFKPVLDAEANRLKIVDTLALSAGNADALASSLGLKVEEQIMLEAVWRVLPIIRANMTGLDNAHLRDKVLEALSTKEHFPSALNKGQPSYQSYYGRTAEPLRSPGNSQRAARLLPIMNALDDSLWAKCQSKPLAPNTQGKKGRQVFTGFGQLQAATATEKPEMREFVERSLALVTQHANRSLLAKEYSVIDTSLRPLINQLNGKRVSHQDREACASLKMSCERKRENMESSIHYFLDQDVRNAEYDVDRSLRNPAVPGLYLLKNILIASDRQSREPLDSKFIEGYRWAQGGMSDYKFGSEEGQKHDLVHYNQEQMYIADIVVLYLKHRKAEIEKEKQRQSGDIWHDPTIPMTRDELMAYYDLTPEQVDAVYGSDEDDGEGGSKGGSYGDGPYRY